MPVELLEAQGGRVLEIHASGKLSKEDYAHFLPKVEGLIKQYGKISILFEMSQFHGWEAGALWEDLKFDFKHFRDIDRLAMIGETKWQGWMAQFCRPFTTASIRYFTHSEIEAARRWVEGQKAAGAN